MRTLLQWSILACALGGPLFASVFTSAECSIYHPLGEVVASAKAYSHCDLGSEDFGGAYAEATAEPIGRFGGLAEITAWGANQNDVITLAYARAEVHLT